MDFFASVVNRDSPHPLPRHRCPDYVHGSNHTWFAIPAAQTPSLLYEQSTNLVKSVRRPIGHTTAGAGGNARLRTTREHQELRHHSTGKYTHNTFLRKTNFFTSQDMLSCVFETSQKLS